MIEHIRGGDPSPLSVRVALALGWTHCEECSTRNTYSKGSHWHAPSGGSWMPGPRFDEDWHAAGPLIERFGINLTLVDGVWWACRGWQGDHAVRWKELKAGKTPLVAVCEFILAFETKTEAA